MGKRNTRRRTNKRRKTKLYKGGDLTDDVRLLKTQLTDDAERFTKQINSLDIFTKMNKKLFLELKNQFEIFKGEILDMFPGGSVNFREEFNKLLSFKQKFESGTMNIPMVDINSNKMEDIINNKMVDVNKMVGPLNKNITTEPEPAEY